MSSLKYQKYKGSIKQYQETHKEEWNAYMRIYAKRYRELHKDKTRQWYKEGYEKIRFGGLRQFILERDNYMCQECNMTNDEHKRRWNRSLTIDHIDGKGINAKEKNNNPDNLITLCLICHGRKDRLRQLLTK